MAVELASSESIQITNNRRTTAKSDDITVKIYRESLFYDDKTSRVWTTGFVKVLDEDQSAHADPGRRDGDALDP